MTNEQQALLAQMFETVWDAFTNEGYEIEIQPMIDLAVKHGFVEKTAYDPAEHSNFTGDCEPGDDYYIIANPGRELLQIAHAAQ